MATKKFIWILIGMVVIMAWLLGSVTQVGAQTYTSMMCILGKYPVSRHFDV